MLTQHQRDVLISHLDGPCAVVLPRGGLGAFDGRSAEITRRWTTTSRLMMCGLLRGDPGGAARPLYTIMTPAGREALAEALAALADVLVAAGYGLEPPAGWPHIEGKEALTLPALSFRGHKPLEDAPCVPPPSSLP